MSMSIKRDLRRLLMLEKQADERADRIIGKIAGDMDTHIKTHMSRQSPSPVGDPPGVDTGALKNSIRHSRLALLTWVVQAGYAGMDYALYLEYGTARMGARPYMRPGVRAIEDKVPKAFKEFTK